MCVGVCVCLGFARVFCVLCLLFVSLCVDVGCCVGRVCPFWCVLFSLGCLCSLMCYGVVCECLWLIACFVVFVCVFGCCSIFVGFSVYCCFLLFVYVVVLFLMFFFGVVCVCLPISIFCV